MKSTFKHKLNVLVVAGEKSGEEHFLSFFPTLRSKCPEISWWGVGGSLMHSQGFELIYHLKEFSTWGFSEALKKIPFYIKALRYICKQALLRETPVAILIDFQGFNLRLARRLSGQGVKIFYYVAPQTWAWKPARTNILKESVYTLFTILPFEKKWFTTRGLNRVISVPHPLWLQYKNDFHHKKKQHYPHLSFIAG